MHPKIIDFNADNTAGKLSAKALRDTTKYDAIEVGHAMSDDIIAELLKCAESNAQYIDQDEFCVVMLLSRDNVLVNLIRRKFFAWPFLPKPRPNQAVFLYNKRLCQIRKRLWILPSDVVMAELHSLSVVHKKYASMKRWTDYFYQGWKAKKVGNEIKFINVKPCLFWDSIRSEHDIKLVSEYEYIKSNRDKLVNASVDCCDIGNADSVNGDEFFGEQIVHSAVSS